MEFKLLAVLLIQYFCIDKSESCYILYYPSLNLVYALCDGTYTMVTANISCHLNGYELSGYDYISGNSIITEMNSMFR